MQNIKQNSKWNVKLNVCSKIKRTSFGQSFSFTPYSALNLWKYHKNMIIKKLP